jgi:hypothetical protein
LDKIPNTIIVNQANSPNAAKFTAQSLKSSHSAHRGGKKKNLPELRSIGRSANHSPAINTATQAENANPRFTLV